MAPADGVWELFRSIDERARARLSRLANAKAFGISVLIHFLILALLVMAASVVTPPWARWSEPVTAPEGRASTTTGSLDVVAGAERRACASPKDSIVAELVRYAKDAVAGAASSTLGLAALPRGDSSRVRYVTEELLCRRAVAAMNTAYRQPANLARAIYLVRLEEGYLVVDTALAKGRYGKSVVMDSALAVIRAW